MCRFTWSGAPWPTWSLPAKLSWPPSRGMVARSFQPRGPSSAAAMCCTWWCWLRPWNGWRRCSIGAPPQEVEDVYVIIVGGGQVGSQQARLLLAEGHEIKVIDQGPEL